MKALSSLVTITLILITLGCGGGEENAGSGERAGGGAGGMRGGPGGMKGGGEAPAAAPVQVEKVTRRSISHALYTNGTLEAEQEVELVARTSGPVTELHAEEGMRVKKGQIMARIDPREAANQVATAKVAHDEARMAFDRAKTTFEGGLTSQESYDTAISQLQSAEVQLEKAEIQLSYTEIRAPFDALVVNRHIRLAQHVSSGANLFRISDFNPLLCPIEVPEKDLPTLSVGQNARIRVESYPDEEFSARVLRIRPTIDAATGTVTITLEVDGRGKLRPGMFASAFVETETHENAVVIRRDALVLDSLGDTVFVREGENAVRRNVSLGFREDQLVEVLEGLAEGEELIVLGQDGLADGTPVTVLGDAPAVADAPGEGGPSSGAPSPEMLESIKQRMKERGMSDEEIAERMQRMRDGGGRMGPPGGGDAGGGIPPMMEQRIKDAAPEDLERIKERMRSFGMDDATIDANIKRIRGGEGQ